MPSKYTAYLHFGQTEMDKLIELFPNLKDSGNVTEICKLVFDEFLSGKYSKQQEKKTNRENKKDEKLDQEIIKLKIQNRISLIHDLQVSPDFAHKVTEIEVAVESVIGNLNDSPVQSVNAGASPYDPKQDKQVGINLIARFECIDCGVLFEFPKGEFLKMENSMMAYFRHIQFRHDRILTEKERTSFTTLGLKI